MVDIEKGERRNVAVGFDSGRDGVGVLRREGGRG